MIFYIHVSLATLVKDYEPLTEEERTYTRNPLTYVDFLLFNQMDKQPVLTIEVDGTGFHENPWRSFPQHPHKNHRPAAKSFRQPGGDFLFLYFMEFS